MPKRPKVTLPETPVLLQIGESDAGLIPAEAALAIARAAARETRQVVRIRCAISDRILKTVGPPRRR